MTLNTQKGNNMGLTYSMAHSLSKPSCHFLELLAICSTTLIPWHPRANIPQQPALDSRESNPVILFW
jgi:hypothetical protein